jgi:anti-sigma B factor antagonist
LPADPGGSIDAQAGRDIAARFFGGDLLMGDPQRRARARTQPVVVTLPAEIDISNADRIGQELCAAFAPGVRTVIADMTGTTFCDSSGISMLVLAHRKAMTNNAELRLVALSTAVLRALTLVRIDYLLTVYPSLADALLPEPPPEPAAAK